MRIDGSHRIALECTGSESRPVQKCRSIWRIYWSNWQSAADVLAGLLLPAKAKAKGLPCEFGAPALPLLAPVSVAFAGGGARVLRQAGPRAAAEAFGRGGNFPKRTKFMLSFIFAEHHLPQPWPRRTSRAAPRDARISKGGGGSSWRRPSVPADLLRSCARGARARNRRR
jgi:hypothetical protein